MKKFLVLFLFLASYISAQTINGVPVTLNAPESSITSLVSDLASKQATLSAASGSQNGYLLSTDWATFNAKQNPLGFTPENVANKGVANGYPSLDSNALLPASFLPANLGNSLTFGPGGSGAGSAHATCNAGGSSFSQCGFLFSFNNVLTYGFYVNLQNAPISYNYPSLQTGGLFGYYTIYDSIDGVDRLEALAGPNAPIFLNPQDGNVGIGGNGVRAAPLPLSFPNGVAFDPTTLDSTSLTNGTFSSSGASWTQTNDCSFGTSSAICAFSAGTASTISQASGTLAIPGVGNRIYKLTYTVSGVSGTPSAAITSAFASISAANPSNLYLANGTWHLYIASVNSTGAFTIATTLTSGQAFTLTNLSLQQVLGGTFYAGNQVNSRTFGTSENCVSTSSPAPCSKAAAGIVQVAASGTSIQVNTTAVTTNSRFALTYSTVGISSPANMTSLGPPYISAINSGVSFTITLPVAPTTNPINITYILMN